ncbi:MULTISPECIES: FtsX-like permease family protein [Terrabacteria group]|uniref:FtsX-like permease family protein n=1 Tax=Bacillati TaxID=1783272 RepID=UPI001C6F4651|nr:MULTISPECIES: FtsX-like permease family protein [Terrabacteria group]MBW9212752.1 FtsX-like permease family protein [Trueperella sp. zg.1013]
MFKLYSRLAIQNIHNDRKRFVPFLLAMSLLTLMMYNFISMGMNPYILNSRGGRNIIQVLTVGRWIVGIATLIISFYAYSFVLKGRQEEFSLLNTLGLEKKHIRSMVLIELLLLYLGTIVLGITLGILVDKLIFAAMTMFLDGQVKFGFFISANAILYTCSIFLALYFGFFIRTGFQIQLHSISSLRQLSSQGEKEPKAKTWLALIGLVFMGFGYYLALTIQNPLKAIAMFVVAVVAVIIGTYCLITAGSITYLKWRKSKKKVYYQPEHFVNISNLLYRMKANAVGLGNIAILSTMVIIILSISASLVIGIKSTIDYQYPRDYEISVYSRNEDTNASDGHYYKIPSTEEAEGYLKAVATLNEKHHIQPQDISYFRATSGTLTLKNGEFSFEEQDQRSSWDALNAVQVTYVLQEDVNRVFGTNLKLKKGELAVYDPDNILQGKDLNYFGTKKKYQTLSNINTTLFNAVNTTVLKQIVIVVDSVESLANVNVLQAKQLGEESRYYLTIKYNGQAIDEEKYMNDLKNVIEAEYHKNVANSKYGYLLNSKRLNYRELLSIHVGTIYVLSMLVVLFTSVSVLVIYYKQVSEGTRDRENYLIMRKVGMDERMIHRTIRQQVKIIFFLPPLIATMHVLAATKFMHLVLQIIVKISFSTFAWITFASLAVYLIFFYIVYTLTTRTYYDIVKH